MTELADGVRAFLQDIHLAVIATSNRDGSPHQTALWYELRDDHILMNTVTTSMKVRNLGRNTWASVCITGLNPARHVTLQGHVELDDSQVVEDLTALASRYAGPEAGPGMATRIAQVPHISLKLKIEKVYTFGQF